MILLISLTESLNVFILSIKRKYRKKTIQLARLSAEAAGHLKQAIYCLPTLKKFSDIFNHCKEIDNVERKAHKVVLAG